MESTNQPGGTIVRGDDGTIYFIRDEVLAMTRVTEPDMAAFCAQLLDGNQPETAGFALASGGQIDTLAFSGPFQRFDSGRFNVGEVSQSTIMCPGSMKDKSFEVLNPFSVGF